MASNLTASINQKLADLVGKECLASDVRLEEYSIDGSIPQAVVQPVSTEALCEVMAWASSEKLAVAPRGGGTRMSLGNPPAKLDLVLDLSKLDHLLDYQPADLTATVEAGITLAALQGELAAGGKSLPLEAPLSSKATIGGTLATNGSGPLRHSYGLARDWLIGISAVSADGVLTKAGGKVVKNVTGYDLNKLYCGSLGTLGVIVEATFKLAPLGTHFGALVATFASAESSICGARDLLAEVYSPQGVQVIDSLVARRLGLNVPSGNATIVAFCSGRARAVQRRLEESDRLLQERGSVSVERGESTEGKDLLARITDLGWTQDSVPELALKINVPPSHTASVINWCANLDILPAPGFLADPGFGSVKLLWWNENPLDEGSMVEVITKLREKARSSGGSAVVEQCPLSVKQQIDVWGGPVSEMDVMRRIKQSFDPANTLNPGRLMGSL